MTLCVLSQKENKVGVSTNSEQGFTRQYSLGSSLSSNRTGNRNNSNYFYYYCYYQAAIQKSMMFQGIKLIKYKSKGNEGFPWLTVVPSLSLV